MLIANLFFLLFVCDVLNMRLVYQALDILLDSILLILLRCRLIILSAVLLNGIRESMIERTNDNQFAYLSS